ncbi:MAG: signal peptidase I, partial [Eubacterium sp.]|nr:signal peptidase I [Eubacterium sp.]
MSEGFNPDKLFSDIDKILQSQGIDTSSYDHQGPLVVPDSLKDGINPDVSSQTTKTTPEPKPMPKPEPEPNPEPATIKPQEATQHTQKQPFSTSESKTNEIPVPDKPVEFVDTAKPVEDPKKSVDEGKIEPHQLVDPVKPSKFTTIESPKKWDMELVLEPAEPELGVYEPDQKPSVTVIHNTGKITGIADTGSFGDVSLGVETESVEYDEGHPVLRFFRNLLICAVVAFVLAIVITKFVAHHTQVDGTSMEETLKNGDELIVEQVSYYLHDPERFDVIVFPTSTHDSYIKRIIGLPGETIQIMDGKIYVNGNLLPESYGKD